MLADRLVQAQFHLQRNLPARPICNGGSAGFEANITGAVGTPSFDWQRKRPSDADFISIGAPNSTTITISNAGSTADPDQTEYRVVITDNCGINATTSLIAILTVVSPPAITSQPVAVQTLSIGCTASFSVTASSNAVLSYQWRKNGDAIGGAVSSTYSIPNLSIGDAGNYDVVITNSCGTVTSAISVLNVNSPCAITGGSDAVCTGAATTWEAPAGMSTYSWSGPNGFSETTPSITISEAGTYDLTITDANGCQSSCSRILTVKHSAGYTIKLINQCILLWWQ
jgi:hypothetical protein